MTETRELRFATSPLEERARSDGKVVMRGYAYRFNELSHDLGGFRERIAPGAGAPSLRQNDVYATFNHDTRSLLGRVSSGTLTVGEDREGGWYEIELPDTTTGRDVAALLKRGDLAGSSFTFRVLDGGQRRADEDDPETGLPVREITAMDVVELGPVVNPAYPTTQASLRSIEKALGVELRAKKDEDDEPEEGDEKPKADDDENPDDKPDASAEKEGDESEEDDEPEDTKKARALVRALIMRSGQ